MKKEPIIRLRLANLKEEKLTLTCATSGHRKRDINRDMELLEWVLEE